MNVNSNKFPLTQGINPWLGLAALILLSFGAMLIFSAIGVAIVGFFLDIDKKELATIVTGQSVNEKALDAIFIIQGLTSLGAFIVAPLAYIRFIDKTPAKAVFTGKGIGIRILLVTVLIVIVFMGVNSVIIEWNANLKLPDFLEEFEKYAQLQEEQYEKMTRFLTSTPDLWYFMISILVIAVLPGVGEELLFRGLIQNKLYAGIGNIHWAIWITGFIFGAIHGQFFGIVPRMFLGVLFGYLYYWSGNLIIPMTAHFINNAFTVTMLYLYRNEVIGYDMAEQTSTPISAVIISFVTTILLIIYFRNYYKKREASYG